MIPVDLYILGSRTCADIYTAEIQAFNAKVTAHPAWPKLDAMRHEIARRLHKVAGFDGEYSYTGKEPWEVLNAKPNTTGHVNGQWFHGALPKTLCERYNRLANRIAKDLGIKSLMPWDIVRLAREEKA